MLAVSHLHTVHGNFSSVEIIRNGTRCTLITLSICDKTFVFQFDPSSHEWLNVASKEYDVCVKASGSLHCCWFAHLFVATVFEQIQNLQNLISLKCYRSRKTGNSLFFHCFKLLLGDQFIQWVIKGFTVI